MPQVRKLVTEAQASSTKDESRARYRSAIHKFKQKVRGRIEHVGHVKGKKGEEGRTYRYLRNWYDFLVEFDNEVTARFSDLKEEVIGSDPAYAKRQGRYRSMIEKINNMSKNDLCQKLDGLSENTLEFGWINQDKDYLDLKSEVKRVAYSALTSPQVTGHFFSYFNREDGCFRGLLHDPEVVGRSTRDLLADATGIFAVYGKQIPNNLKSVVKDFIEKCKVRVRDNSSWHPYTDQEFRENVVLPFKKRIRFDDDEAVDLINHIEDTVTEFHNSLSSQDRTEPNVNVRPVANTSIFTNTEEVLKGLSSILRSTLEHMSSVSNRLEIDIAEKPHEGSDSSLDTVAIEIFNQDGIITKKPNLHSLFGGDLQSSLRYLRGYVGWSLVAPFSDGHSYQFDVMRNNTTRLDEPVHGVKHTIRFYQ